VHHPVPIDHAQHLLREGDVVDRVVHGRGNGLLRADERVDSGVWRMARPTVERLDLRVRQVLDQLADDVVAAGVRHARGFGKALQIGVSTLELDTGVTKDGVVVVSHERRISPLECQVRPSPLSALRDEPTLANRGVQMGCILVTVGCAYGERDES
jgi:hypothetical protein